jgi:hypothetical protein
MFDIMDDPGEYNQLQLHAVLHGKEEQVATMEKVQVYTM